jgi:rubrerythrin
MEIKTKVGMVEITQKIKDDERLWWLQAAIEKADPRKPDMESSGAWVCPRCGVMQDEWNQYGYCPECGQRIDWEGMKLLDDHSIIHDCV